jgi:hypothetical protein
LQQYQLTNLINNIKMPSVSTILKGLFALAPLVAAAPAKVDVRSMHAAAPAAASASAAPAPAATQAAAPGGGLSDVDILNL